MGKFFFGNFFLSGNFFWEIFLGKIFVNEIFLIVIIVISSHLPVDGVLDALEPDLPDGPHQTVTRWCDGLAFHYSLDQLKADQQF